MATADINLGHFNIGSVDRIRFTISKDEIAWNNIDSVAFVFERPDRDSTGVGTQFTRTATEETPGSNVWYYDTTVDDFDIAGEWSMNVRITDGAITKRYPYAIDFEVHDYP